jgi:glutaredoxin 2
MTQPADPILYSFRRCPFAMRARLALAVSGTRYELREISLRAKPTAMLAASAKGTVPVLVLPGGEVIDESLDIMRWALWTCDPEGWLERDDDSLIAANEGSFKHDIDRYKYPDRHEGDALTHREHGLTFLRDLDARLTIDGFLGGATRA